MDSTPLARALFARAPHDEPADNRGATLAGATVWLIGCDDYTNGYLGMALSNAEAVAEERDAAAVITMPPQMPTAAIVDLSLGAGALLSIGDLLRDRAIPFLLVGSAAARPPVLLGDRPCLLQPFASFEVIDTLRALIAGSDTRRQPAGLRG